MPPLLSPPTYTLLALYPRTATSTFHLPYYLSSHMPLTERLWGPYGFSIHSITSYDDTQSTQYHLSCVMEFSSKEGYEKAMGSEGTAEIVKDMRSGRVVSWGGEGEREVVFLGGVVAG
jgi:uncharacterized protein (TIGR02118 family)